MQTKVCPSCNERKSFEEFYNNKSAKDGKQCYCKICTKKKQKKWYQNNPERARAMNRESYRKNGANWNSRPRTPEEGRAIRLRLYYKLTVDAYNAMLAAQNYRCAICNTDDPPQGQWHVDHDHSCCPEKWTCGECVRQILCSPCNLAIGLLGDNPETVLAAAEYLLRHSGKRLAA